jgi:hypothetical protein
MISNTYDKDWGKDRIFASEEEIFDNLECIKSNKELTIPLKILLRGSSFRDSYRRWCIQNSPKLLEKRREYHRKYYAKKKKEGR